MEGREFTFMKTIYDGDQTGVVDAYIHLLARGKLNCAVFKSQMCISSDV